MGARSRLTDLRRSFNSIFDEEAGEAPLQLLVAFNRESDKINQVLVWAQKRLGDASVKVSRANGEDDSLQRVEKNLDEVEKKLKAVRTRLTRMASDNQQFVRDHQKTSPGTVQTRLVQYRKMGQDFLDRVDALSQVRTQIRDSRRDLLNDDLRRINPDVDVKALAAGRMDIEQAIGDVSETVDSSRQLNYIRQRNSKIQSMAQGIAELHALFQDMSVLVNSQQDLINQIEYDVQETKKTADKTVDELQTAVGLQSRANQKRRMIIIILLIVILVIFAIVGIWVYVNWRRLRVQDTLVSALG